MRRDFSRIALLLALGLLVIVLLGSNFSLMPLHLHWHMGWLHRIMPFLIIAIFFMMFSRRGGCCGGRRRNRRGAPHAADEEGDAL